MTPPAPVRTLPTPDDSRTSTAAKAVSPPQAHSRESTQPETPFDKAHPHVAQLEDQYQDLSKKQIKEYGIQDPQKLFQQTMNQCLQDCMQGLTSDVESI